VHAGLAARSGMQAALLARAGVRAAADWLLGTHGMRDVMSGDLDDAAAVAAVRDAVESGQHALETSWGLAQKPYACCGSCHAAVDALIALVTEHDLAADDIEVLELHTDPLVPQVMTQTEPSDPFAARYCLTWVMAVAAVDRAAGPAQFGTESLTRPDVHGVRARVRLVTDLATTDDDRYAGRIVIRTRDGRQLDRTVRHASGHPRNPMTETARSAKIGAALTLVPDLSTRAQAVIDDLPGATSLPL
jgi:2-methylcitrate dehydratase PrpD